MIEASNEENWLKQTVLPFGSSSLGNVLLTRHPASVLAMAWLRGSCGKEPAPAFISSLEMGRRGEKSYPGLPAEPVLQNSKWSLRLTRGSEKWL